MLKLTDNAEVYLEEFKSELLKFEDVTRRSIPIIQQTDNDYEGNKLMHKIHEEEQEEYHTGYWRLVTKLDTVKNLIVLTDEEYKILQDKLNEGLSNYCKLLEINRNQTEKNSFKGEYINDKKSIL